MILISLECAACTHKQLNACTQLWAVEAAVTRGEDFQQRKQRVCMRACVWSGCASATLALAMAVVPYRDVEGVLPISSVRHGPTGNTSEEVTLEARGRVTVCLVPHFMEILVFSEKGSPACCSEAPQVR